MRTVAGLDAAQPISVLTDFTDAVIIKVANSADALVDLTEFAVSLEYDQGTDEIVDAATIVFRRLEGVNSLAPLMTAAPPVAVGRRVVVLIDPGSGTYREVFRGRIGSVDWPERFGEVTIGCLDQGGRPARTWIEDAVEMDSIEGTSLETVMQAVVDTHLLAIVSPLPTLYFPAATGALVQHAAGDAAYAPSDQTVLDALRTLAESIGWTIRWRNFDAAADDWKWTVFEPSRSKVVADHTFGVDDYWDVTTMRQDEEDIRNVVEVEYVGEGGTIESVQYPAEANVATDPSVVAFGRRYMKIVEGTGSPINNSTLALAMATAAYNDLSWPDALVEITGRYFWPGEIGVDLYTFTANNVHFSSDQTLAPMRFSHRIAVGERPTSRILCRGTPSGGVLMWMRKQKRDAGSTVPQTADIIRVSSTASSDGTAQNFTVTVGPRCDTVHIHYRTVPVTVVGDPLDFSETSALEATYPATLAIKRVPTGLNQIAFSVPLPAHGYRIAARMIPYTVPNPDPVEGDSWPFMVDASALGFSYTSAATEDSSGGSGTLTLTVSDPSASISPTTRIQFYKTVNAVRTLVSATSSPASGVTTGTYTLTLTLDPKHNVKVEPLVTYANGDTTTLGAWTFDSDKRANVVSLTQAVDPGTANATVTAVFDTDTVTTATGARYRVDGGSWTDVSVNASYVGTFTVAQDATNIQEVEVQGKDSDGSYGPSSIVLIDPVPPAALVYAECRASVTFTATQATVTVSAASPSGTPTVGYVALTGGGSLSSGHAAGTYTYATNGTDNVWVFDRPAFGAADAQAQFRAILTGGQQDDDFVVIPAQGRDTFGLAVRARVTASTATTVTVRVAVADPYPQGAASATIGWQELNVGAGTSPATGQTVTPVSTITEAAGTYVDFTVTRPAFGAGAGRVTFTATAANRVSDSDAVDVPEVDQDTRPLAMRARITASTATTVTVRVAVADPYPQGAGSATITYTETGGTGTACSPASGGTVTPASTITEAAGTYIDYTVTRPAYKSGYRRVTFTATAANRVSDSDAVDVPPVEQPAVAQGSISIESNGSWNATADGPAEALSFRWSYSTSAFPADATVTSSGTLVTGTGRLLAMTGTALTFGQVLYITIIPFDAVSAGGNALPAIHLQAAYQTTSGSRTTRYAATAFFNGTSGNAGGETRKEWAYGADGKTTTDGTGTPDEHFANVPVAEGMTITAVRLRTYTAQTYSQIAMSLWRQDADGSSTQLGSTQTATNASYSTLTVGSLSESASSGRSYLIRCQTLYDIANLNIFGTSMLWFEVDQDYPDLATNL